MKLDDLRNKELNLLIGVVTELLGEVEMNADLVSIAIKIGNAVEESKL